MIDGRYWCLIDLFSGVYWMNNVGVCLRIFVFNRKGRCLM